LSGRRQFVPQTSSPLWLGDFIIKMHLNRNRVWVCRACSFDPVLAHGPVASSREDDKNLPKR
jgi:hypothetical protein